MSTAGALDVEGIDPALRYGQADVMRGCLATADLLRTTLQGAARAVTAAARGAAQLHFARRTGAADGPPQTQG